MACVTSTAHVLEEAKEAREGIDFLTSYRPHWINSVYGGHITWHLTLYYLGMCDVCV